MSNSKVSCNRRNRSSELLPLMREYKSMEVINKDGMHMGQGSTLSNPFRMSNSKVPCRNWHMIWKLFQLLKECTWIEVMNNPQRQTCRKAWLWSQLRTPNVKVAGIVGSNTRKFRQLTTECKCIESQTPPMSSSNLNWESKIQRRSLRCKLSSSETLLGLAVNNTQNSDF
jgi:hypothetical protein